MENAPAAIIGEAKGLLQLGKNREARDLLLQEGYVNRLVPEIQNAFLELFAPSQELLNEEQTTFRKLVSQQPKIRFEAARYLCRQAHNEINIKREAWLKDPRTVDVLLAAARDDEPKTLAEIALALAALAGRYYQDLRMYPVLQELIRHSAREVQWGALRGVCEFYQCPDQWDVLIPFLVSRSPAKFKGTIAHAIYTGPRELRPFNHALLRKALLSALVKERVPETKLGLIRALGCVGDGDSGLELKQYLKETTDSEIRKRIKEALKDIQERIE
ncbi:MAG: hypothetical protein K1Y36_18115 [Blastocatellia bacterium]|nr:hypothetical protein [Blastocatellia bacterium]